jgi:hypothetical protein
VKSGDACSHYYTTGGSLDSPCLASKRNTRHEQFKFLIPQRSSDPDPDSRTITVSTAARAPSLVLPRSLNPTLSRESRPAPAFHPSPFLRLQHRIRNSPAFSPPYVYRSPKFPWLSSFLRNGRTPYLISLRNVQGNIKVPDPDPTPHNRSPLIPSRGTG